MAEQVQVRFVNIRTLAVALSISLGLLSGCSTTSETGWVTEEGKTSSETLEGGPDYPLFGHSMTWTGEQLVIVGGAGGDITDGLLVDDPLSWNRNRGFEPIEKPPGPVRTRQAAVWTGEEVMIWSGTTEPFGVADGLLSSAAAYEPTTKQWRSLADSPPELGKVSAEGVVVDRIVVFAGGSAPTTEGEALIALYDLDSDQWGTTKLSGPVSDIATKNGQVFVLWDEVAPEDGDPVPSTRLGLLEVEGVTASVVPIELPATNQESWDSVGLAVAGQSLILLSQDSEMVSTLHITELSDGNEPIEWRREVLGDIPSLSPSNDRRIPLSVVGTMVVAHDMTSLYWFDIDNETSMVQSLDPNEGCALGSSSESIVTPDGLVAIGGNCTRVKGGGQEEQLFGSYVFSLAADS